nr:MAG TPA: hypothetical protein [Caudoviricetes sp.]
MITWVFPTQYTTPVSFYTFNSCILRSGCTV